MVSTTVLRRIIFAPVLHLGAPRTPGEPKRSCPFTVVPVRSRVVNSDPDRSTEGPILANVIDTELLNVAARAKREPLISTESIMSLPLNLEWVIST